MRALLRVAAAVLLALAVWAPAPSSAQTSTDRTWTWNVGQPVTVDGSIRIQGDVRTDAIGDWSIDSLKASWAPSQGSNVPDECKGDTNHPESVQPPFEQRSPSRHFEFSIQPWCNGVQNFYVGASASERNRGADDGSATEFRRVNVALPSPPVPSVAATLTAERTVNVTWSAPEGYKLPQSEGSGGSSSSSSSTTEGEESRADPPDFVGYRVERVVGDGKAEQLGDDVITETRIVDKNVPKEGAKITYRVTALRRTGPASEELVASEPTAKTLTVGAPASSTTVQSTSTTSRRARSTGFMRRSTSSRSKTTTTQPKVLGEITGPAAGLPDDEPGGVDPELPEDNLASDALLEADETTPWEDRALLVPVAAGMALLVFALQVRYVIRRAARADAMLEYRPAYPME